MNTEESVIPYEYHHFDFCLAKDESNSPAENLGQVVFGERIRPSPYKIKFLENQTCSTVCTKFYKGGDSDSDRKLMVLKKGMSLNYQHHWIVDNMPVTWCYPLQNDRQYCSTGFPMGCLVRNSRNNEYEDSCPYYNNYNKPGTYYPFNHVDLTITYHSGETEEWGNAFKQNGGRIVSVKVIPRSIHHTDKDHPDCSNPQPLELPAAPFPEGKQFEITYTYSVTFVQNNTIKWSSRWDYILESSKCFFINPKIFVFLFTYYSFNLKIVYSSASYKHSMVQYPQLSRHCSLPLWNGCNDYVENTSQRYC